MAALVTIIPVGLPGVATAQRRTDTPRLTGSAVLACNALVGGVAAMARAMMGHHDPLRAFTRGALGGTVHFGGKVLAVQRGSASPFAGQMVSAVGASMVSNAGSGSAILETVAMPLGPATLRLVVPARKLSFSLNAIEAVYAVHTLTRPGLELQWSRSLEHAAFVFRTVDRGILHDDQPVAGVASGSYMVISDFAENRRATIRHESVHIAQLRFAHDVVGRPIEHTLRKRVWGLRRMPAWLDLGLVVPGLAALDAMIWSGRARGPISDLIESEADLLKRP